MVLCLYDNDFYPSIKIRISSDAVLECYSVQDEVTSIRVQTSLLQGWWELYQTVPVWHDARPSQARLRVLGGARVLHPSQGGDEAAVEHPPEEGGGHRVLVQEPARSDVSSVLVWGEQNIYNKDWTTLDSSAIIINSLKATDMVQTINI